MHLLLNHLLLNHCNRCLKNQHSSYNQKWRSHSLNWFTITGQKWRNLLLTYFWHHKVRSINIHTVITFTNIFNNYRIIQKMKIKNSLYQLKFQKFEQIHWTWNLFFHYFRIFTLRSEQSMKKCITFKMVTTKSEKKSNKITRNSDHLPLIIT